MLAFFFFCLFLYRIELRYLFTKQCVVAGPCTLSFLGISCHFLQGCAAKHDGKSSVIMFSGPVFVDTHICTVAKCDRFDPTWTELELPQEQALAINNTQRLYLEYLNIKLVDGKSGKTLGYARIPLSLAFPSGYSEPKQWTAVEEIEFDFDCVLSLGNLPTGEIKGRIGLSWSASTTSVQDGCTPVSSSGQSIPKLVKSGSDLTKDILGTFCLRGLLLGPNEEIKYFLGNSTSKILTLASKSPDFVLLTTARVVAIKKAAMLMDIDLHRVVTVARRKSKIRGGYLIVSTKDTCHSLFLSSYSAAGFFAVEIRECIRARRQHPPSRILQISESGRKQVSHQPGNISMRSKPRAK